MDDKGKFFLVARFAAQKFPIKELRIKARECISRAVLDTV